MIRLGRAVTQPVSSMFSATRQCSLASTLPPSISTGHDDGTVVLHRVDQAAAVLVWFGVAAARVHVVRWSPSRPCSFFVLDAFSTLYCFDLSVSCSGPVHTEVLLRQEVGLPAPVLSTHFEAGMLRVSLFEESWLIVATHGCVDSW